MSLEGKIRAEGFLTNLARMLFNLFVNPIDMHAKAGLRDERLSADFANRSLVAHRFSGYAIVSGIHVLFTRQFVSETQRTRAALEGSFGFVVSGQVSVV